MGGGILERDEAVAVIVVRLVMVRRCCVLGVVVIDAAVHREM